MLIAPSTLKEPQSTIPLSLTATSAATNDEVAAAAVVPAICWYFWVLMRWWRKLDTNFPTLPQAEMSRPMEWADARPSASDPRN